VKIITIVGEDIVFYTLLASGVAISTKKNNTYIWPANALLELYE
jgi:hypothetical protein